MKYIVVTCETDSNVIINEGVYDTYEEAHRKLVECQDEIIAAWEDDTYINIDHDAETEDNFDVWPENIGYEYYGKILEVDL